MRIALLFSLLLVGATHSPAQAQAPTQPAAPAQTAKPAPAPATAKPAPAQTAKPAPAQTAKPAPAQAGRGGLALLVTRPDGATLGGVSVEVIGPTLRSGTTNPSGQLSITGLQAGTYRLRFTGEEVTAFEREVAVRANQTLTVDTTLNPAPPPREIIRELPAPPPPPPGPSGQVQVLSLVDLAERELERRQPRRETLVACSVDTRSTLLQINQDQPQRLYDDAEQIFYVIAGEGFLTVDGRETRLVAGSFASVPRATSFTLGRRGRNPLILLSVLNGEPCEEVR